MKKMKCKVCGKRFDASPHDRYTAFHSIEGGLNAVLSGTNKSYFDAYDCPGCGCQITVGERLPRLTGGANISTEKEQRT